MLTTQVPRLEMSGADSILPICFQGVSWDFTFHSAIIFVIITTVSSSDKCLFVYVQDKNIVTNDSCT